MSQTITTGKFLELPLAKLKPAPDNPRRDVGDVTELAMSIKEGGLHQPLVVVERDGAYLIVAGHRRLAAAKTVGLSTVPCVLREMTEDQRVAAMLVENLQRSDLAPLEEAKGISRLVEEFEVSQRDVAKRIGRSQPHVSKRLALLTLPENVRVEVDSGGITLADAAELAKLGDDEKAIAGVLKRVCDDKWRTVAGEVETETGLREKRGAIEVKAKSIEKTGKYAKVIRPVPAMYGRWDLPKGVYRMNPKADWGSDVLVVAAAKHEKDHPECHAVSFDPKSGDVFPVCTNRKKHPEIKTPNQICSAQQSAQHKAYLTKRQTEDERKAELEPIVAARREFVLELLGRKSAFTKDAALELILREAIVNAWQQMGHQTTLAFAAQLGFNNRELGPALELWTAKGIAELMRVALAATILTLDGENATAWDGARGAWGVDDLGYLEFLAQYGYEISDVERKSLPTTKAKAA